MRWSRPFEDWFDAWAFAVGLREAARPPQEGWVCFDVWNALRFLGLSLSPWSLKKSWLTQPLLVSLCYERWKAKDAKSVTPKNGYVFKASLTFLLA